MLGVGDGGRGGCREHTQDTCITNGKSFHRGHIFNLQGLITTDITRTKSNQDKIGISNSITLPCRHIVKPCMFSY